MNKARSFKNFWLSYVVAVVELALSQRVSSLTCFAQGSESTLSTVRRSDVSSKDAQGTSHRLTPAEHMRRAAVYMNNRAFEEARTTLGDADQVLPAGLPSS
jgi:hypothetical protein